MTIYRRGSKGSEVERIQERLQELGFYLGPIDGIYGGGTESGVRRFQRREQIQIDGLVGPQTWDHLFGEEEVPTPAIHAKPLDYRSQALTGSFETGRPIPECFAGLSGDFDGQGISFGALQWNFGQGSLQPLLQRMNERHPGVMEDVFDSRRAELESVLSASHEEQMQWARSIQDTRRGQLNEPWAGLFKTLGRTSEFQQIQVDAAQRLYEAAQELCDDYQLWSERAVALMFDIKVQNGSIGAVVRRQIMRDFEQLQAEDEEDRELKRLRVVANRRAEASNPRWVEDVRRRKLTIANGQGSVHGSQYNLEEQYGIRLRAIAE